MRDLDGGYIMAMYRIRTRGQTLIPFARVQRYDGGKKLEVRGYIGMPMLGRSQVWVRQE